ncbi:MAG: DNA repair protein RecN [Elusimicrobiota bacterium]|nr:DNA repair protein RecN [Elusimicrobiota bacterium]
MLKSISIKDFAIIANAELSFESGLNVFTGETGAGKSIVIEALGFALGARGDSGLIRHGAQKMTVSAVFATNALPQELKEKYALTSDVFTIKRELDTKAKSRAWLDAKPILIADLAHIGEHLVDFHGQHEHQSLFKSSVHLDLLDSFAELSKDLAKVNAAYKETKEIETKINDLEMSAAQKEKTLDLYKYQLSEIEKLSPKLGEDEELETNLPRLKNAGKLKEEAFEAHNLLSEREGSATELLYKIENILNDMAQADPSLLEIAKEFAASRTVVEDASATISSYKESIDIDPQVLDDMLSRQEALRKAKAKYGPALSDVIAFGETLKTRIAALENGSDNLENLKTALEIAAKKLLSISDALYTKRIKAAKELSDKVISEIRPLGFEEVRFEVGIEHTDNIGPRGADNVEFLFSANLGMALRPLRNIVSGGEISRLMLGLKTVLAGGTPVMVFDEIDAGISGQTGKLVGLKLKKLSLTRQVLCVTHLAQVAAYAKKHFNVSKIVKAGQTEVKVSVLEDVSKTQEIARMIGSSKVASAGYQHAQDLLKEAQTNLK